MAQPTIQTSFASGEWAPKLRSRVDIAKFHSGAALLRNFYVDYSGGGASTRAGTRFINQCKSSGARLIPFQPSTTVGYILEFGQNYIRFYTNGAPVLENAVTGGSACSGDTFTITNTFAVGDWVYALDWGGMTNVNGNYFIISSASGSAVSVTDLNGNAVTFTGTYTSGGQLQRVYTITTPYNASDLFPNQRTGNPGIKYVQDVTSLIICHPSYSPAILTINSATDWNFAIINFGTTIATPTGLTLTTTLATLSSGWNYAYTVTAVDANGQESIAPTPITLSGYQGLWDSAHIGTNLISWTAVPGAVSYNVYKASPSFNTAIPTGAQYGFIGNVTGTSMVDAYPGIGSDFSQTPPVSNNPFVGAGVQSYTVTATGTYTSVPAVTVAAPSSGGQATAVASLGVTAQSINSHGIDNVDILTNGNHDPNGSFLLFNLGVVLQITSTTFKGTAGGGSLYEWEVNSCALYAAGSITSGSTPSNPRRPIGCSSTYVNTIESGFNFNHTWGVTQVLGINPGSGYTSAPAVSFSSGSAAATAILGSASAGNPGVPGFFQERLMLAAQQQSIQDYNLSQPGAFFNFNVSNPIEDDDAISGEIIGEDLNDIRSLIIVPTGIIALTGKGAWLINGGGGISTMNPITPSNQTANPQAFNGANDLRPQKINFDVIYGTNKGGYFRDLTYNIYANIYTGQDISVLSNHLFFGHTFLDVTWAEEPFKTIWIIRDDGTLLSLGFVKEQDLIGWAHHDTNGQFTSVASVIETVNGNVLDAVYLITQRLVNGNYVSYVERMADRYFTYGYEDSWCVDCALQTSPSSTLTGQLLIAGDVSAVGNSVTLTDSIDAPFTSGMATDNYVVRADGGIYQITAYTSTSEVTASVVRSPNTFNEYTNAAFPVADGWTIWTPVTTVSGLTQLIGESVYGVADGAVVGPLTVDGSGSVTLTSAATKVTLGLPFLPQLQTLQLDLGEPTIQSKRKKESAITIRVADTLGLQVGTSFATAVTMKDFQLNAIPTTSTGPSKVIDLYSGDGRTVLDPLWQETGQLCIQQGLPYPATILGIMPEVTVGDTPR